MGLMTWNWIGNIERNVTAETGFVVVVVLAGLVVIDIGLAAFGSRFGPVDAALTHAFHIKTYNNSLNSRIKHEITGSLVPT